MGFVPNTVDAGQFYLQLGFLDFQKAELRIIFFFPSLTSPLCPLLFSYSVQEFGDLLSEAF